MHCIIWRVISKHCGEYFWVKGWRQLCLFPLGAKTAVSWRSPEPRVMPQTVRCLLPQEWQPPENIKSVLSILKQRLCNHTRMYSSVTSKKPFTILLALHTSCSCIHIYPVCFHSEWCHKTPINRSFVNTVNHLNSLYIGHAAWIPSFSNSKNFLGIFF